ncbi:hypothetical protein GC105_02450 [Alkalibaculum sp. M08DMB]|uniref:SipW-cognate class signal peptide n=1 Tax=Alkalibaculum sporogenes TaxID=2655001 RepID=A0A6A7K5M9_9FIRM|nr:SipW-dependent-type signal peptide-containing protein [Alkalibaculum sporogenes]MPW24654.1 hypothetical protein [Alkalibaculum sporogenes]
MKKNKLLSTILVVILVSALTIAGTIAYLTDRDEATNTFTVGNVAIELSEPNWDMDNSKIIPGKVIEKDPVVTVLAGSESAYVRVKVTIPAKLKAIMEDLELNNGWSMVTPVTGDDYYFEYGEVLSSGTNTELPPVFDEIKIKGPGVSNETLAALTDNDLKITVVAQAIQSANFANQGDAWVAFEVE